MAFGDFKQFYLAMAWHRIHHAISSDSWCSLYACRPSFAALCAQLQSEAGQGNMLWLTQLLGTLWPQYVGQMQLRLLLHTIKWQACRHGVLLVMCTVVSLTVIILFQHVAYLFFSLWRYLQQICCMIEEVHFFLFWSVLKYWTTIWTTRVILAAVLGFSKLK